jgi:hypothetical protein
VALLIALSFFLAMLPASANAQSSGSACQRETKYDPVANLTTVECTLFETYTPPIRLVVTANASYQGKQPNETAKFYFNLSVFRSDSNRRTQPLFKDATTLLLSLDATHLAIPITEFHTNFFEMNRLLAEHAQVRLDRENLRKVFDAKSFLGKWSNTEFKLSDESLLALKKFVSDQIFSASER